MSKNQSGKSSKFVKIIKQHSNSLLLLAVILVVVVTFVSLSLPAATATPQLICQKEEHTHNDACYREVKTLVCGQTETTGDSSEDGETHIHSEECYQVERVLDCGKEEHTHTEACYEQAGSIKSETSDHMTAEVRYDAGVIHANTVLSAKLPVDDDEKAAVEKVSKLLDDKKEEIAAARVYDLNLVQDETSVQPDGKVKVTLQYDTAFSAEQENISWRVFSLNDKADFVELTKQNTTVIETDSVNAVKKIELETDYVDQFVLIGTKSVDEEVIAESTAELSETDSTEEKPQDSNHISEDDVEPVYPAQKFEDSANGIHVSVQADEGALSEGTTMNVSKMSQKEILTQALDAAGMENAEAKAVDISFLDVNGQEIEPQKPVRVTMQADEVAGTNDLRIVHVDDWNHTSIMDQLSGQELREEDRPSADEVIFDADSFSSYVIVYTVDFHYGTYDYSIEGESSIRLSELLDVLKIYREDGSLLQTEDVAEVTFSDDSLISVNYENGDWVLRSLAPFQTEETLKLTLKSGDEVVIDVTDDAVTKGMTVTGMTLLVNGQEYDLKNTDQVHIKNTDALEFTMNYTIAPNTLSAENNTVVYKLPEGLKITQTVSNKNIMNGNTIVGTYSIDTDGTITFVYNDTYVQKNAGGSQITADLSFSASVDDSKIDQDGKVDIDFSDELNIDLDVEKVEEGDLSIQKWASNGSFKDGYIEYTIVVSSTAGTSKEITVNDILTTSGLKIDSFSDFTITPKLDASPSYSDNGFGITLPKLDAGANYRITYRVNYDKSTVPIEGTSVNNKIKAESEASKGTKLTASSEVNTNTKPDDTISKSGTVNKEDGTVTWTVKVNGAQSNLKGWTLEDTFNGAPFTETVTVSPAIEGKTTIDLPYKWEKDDFNTYTITYTTTSDALIGKWGAVNKATLRNGDGSTSTGEKTAEGGDGVQFKPIEKSADQITANEEHTEAIVDWTVTINASKGTIKANWTYKDELWNSQWFTGAQLKEVKAAIDQALKENGLSDLKYTMKANLQKGTDDVGDEVEFDKIKDDEKYKVYTLYWKSDLPKGKSFTYQYKSTAPIKGLEKSTTFRNNAYVEDNNGNKVYDDGQINYNPPKEPEIIKTGKNGEDKDTSYDIGSLDDILQWNVKVTIPTDYNGTTLTMTEHLPAGVNLKDLEILAQGHTDTIFGATHFKNPEIGSNKLTINGIGGPYEVELILTRRSDGGLDASITIPENLVKNPDIQEVRFVIQADPTATSDNISDESSGWIKNGDGYWFRKFENTVELIDKDKKVIDSDSQNQDITLKDRNKLVTKSTGTVGDNIVPYSLSINPDGKDLVEGSDNIVLTDILRYPHNTYYLVTTTYVEGSLKVYERKSDGSKGTELKDGYSFTYEESIDNQNLTDGNPTAVRTLKVTLPDSRPLIVEYSYMVSEPNGEYGRNTTLSNRAYLEGYSENRDADSKSTYIAVVKSNAHASIEGLTLQKVDADNFNVKLEGVKFSLYRYDKESDTYKKTDKIYTTDSTGSINFTKSDIDYETAYKLVEESTKSGYFSEKAPYYFIVTKVDLKEGETANYIQPDDFNGTVYSAGSSFYFKNRKIPEKGLSVSKVWKDYEGNVVTDTSNFPEIQIRLKKDGTVIDKAVLNEKNGWTEMFNDLDPNGQYTVEEATELQGYKAPVIVYEQGDGVESSYIVGGSYGSATITNQPEGPTPEGGSTSVAVKKKWVGTDETTELTGDSIKDLTAEIELVRYRIPQKKEAGTTLVFYAGNGGNNFIYASSRVVKQNQTVKLRFNINKDYYSNGFKIYPITQDPTGQWNTFFNTQTPLDWKIISEGSDIYIEYTLNVGTEDTIYLCTEPSRIITERTDTVKPEYLQGMIEVGELQVDTGFKRNISLSSQNDWLAAFMNLPTSEVIEDTSYAYYYAIKEVSCSKDFALEGYSTGQNGVDGSNIPISNISSNITVTNRQKEAFELPKTGGAGTIKFILGGFSLMMIAMLLYLQMIRKNLRKEAYKGNRHK